MIAEIWKKVCSRESVSYVIFGVLTTAVDWVTYTVLWSVGADYRISTALSWMAAVLFAFITNKFFVFRSFDIHLSRVWKEFLSFVVCRLATGIVTMVGMVIMVDMLHWNEFFAKLMVSVITLVSNYVLSKLFIFRKTGGGAE